MINQILIIDDDKELCALLQKAFNPKIYPLTVDIPVGMALRRLQKTAISL